MSPLSFKISSCCQAGLMGLPWERGARAYCCTLCLSRYASPNPLPYTFVAYLFACYPAPRCHCCYPGTGVYVYFQYTQDNVNAILYRSEREYVYVLGGCTRRCLPVPLSLSLSLSLSLLVSRTMISTCGIYAFVHLCQWCQTPYTVRRGNVLRP